MGRFFNLEDLPLLISPFLGVKGVWQSAWYAAELAIWVSSRWGCLGSVACEQVVVLKHWSEAVTGGTGSKFVSDIPAVAG